MFGSIITPSNFSSKPALVMALSMIIGLVIGLNYLEMDSIEYYYFFLAIGLFIALVSILLKKFMGTAFILSCLMIGIYLSGNIPKNRLIDPNKTIGEIKAIMDGKVDRISIRTSKYVKFLAKGTCDIQQGLPITNSNVFIKLHGDSTKLIDIKPGDLFIANIKARLPKKAVLEYDFDEMSFARTNRIDFIATTNHKNISFTGRSEGLDRYRNIIINSVYSKIDILFSERNAPIIKALLMGDRSMIDQGMNEEFSLVGTAHVLSVSGLHVATIATIAFFLTAFIRNSYLKFLVFSILVMCFVFLSGLQPSAIRAGGMSILYMFVLLIYRKADILNILAVVIVIILFFDTKLILSPGLQMSAFAVASIIILSSQFYDLLFKIISRLIGTNFISKFFSSSLAVSMSATLGISPLVAYYFGHLSLYSPIANLVVVPAFNLTMVFSLIGIGISYLSIPIGSFYSLSSEFLLDIAIRVNHDILHLPYSYIKNEFIIYYSLFFTVLMTYAYTAKSVNRFAFRFVFVVICLLSVFYFFGDKQSKFYGIESRDNFVALILPESEKKDLILIADRRPFLKPSLDYGLLWRIWNSDKEIDYYFAGNCGMAINDLMKNSGKKQGKEANLEILNYLKEKLKLKQEIPQILNSIDYDKITRRISF